VLYLRFNRKLLWVALPAVLWAYLGLFAALAQGGPPGQPPLGLRLRLPPGSLELPGRLVEVRETPGQLYIALEAGPDSPRQALDPQGQPVKDLPPGVQIDFLPPSQATGRMLTVQTLRGQTRPIELPGPGHRQFIECEQYIIGLGPRGAALIPNEGRAAEWMDRLLERRGADGPPRPDHRRDRRPRNWLREWLDGPRRDGREGPGRFGGRRRDRPGQGAAGQPGAGQGQQPGQQPGPPPDAPPPAGQNQPATPPQ
jgi:hypothetical protein